ncbi:hypothetical protein Thimo_1754 [Thioflavicoccus mobilis 8321]|uniref:Uncharacterized protein n=1 Tax=Thioflavicoccus mobilis 8321 TaxID=765912 RepID=L0GUV8_9GAMM|nr:hypothetical protein Thimo_1754 [Thioflavicoccus mobilis 8321]
MRKIRVTDIHEVGNILDYVHDRIFQLSEISFDRKNQTLNIPLTAVSDEMIDRTTHLLFSTWSNPIVKCVLTINNVSEVGIMDDAQIGEAPINEITIEDGVVVIECSVPVTLRAKVANLDLQLTLEDYVVGRVRRFSFRRKLVGRGEERS